MSQPVPEPLVSTLARRFTVEVNTGTTAVPVWTTVRAIGELQPSIDSTLEDDSDYDSDGWASQTKTAMQWALEITLIRKIGFDTARFDPGQEAIRAAADQFGPDATVHVRWYDRTGGPEAYEGFATVSWAPEGGGPTALDTVTATLTGQGARRTITNPTPAPPGGTSAVAEQIAGEPA